MTAKAWAVLMAGALGLTAIAYGADEASQRLNFGKQEYEAKCAVCHGVSGLGAGQHTESLIRAPADLTTYARRNGGAVPRQLAWLTIDGRTLDEHIQRTREMPLWGQDLRNEALANPTYRAPEKYVSERIAALVDYLETLQVK